MRILSLLRNTLEMSDFFYSTQMLRFQKQGEYRTLTGGILSIGIIVTIVIGFTSMIKQTINKSSFTTDLTVEKKPDPSATIMTAHPDTMFMFGIEVWRHNLNAQKRFFDIKAMAYKEESGWAVTTDLEMVPCTKEHWIAFPDLVRKFQTLQMNYWLCPPIGASYEIFGKYTADHYKQVAFYVYPCNNATDPNRPCATQTEIDAYFNAKSHNFFFTFYFINPVVNPGSTDYIKYYLEDKNYVQFGSQQACEAYLYITDYTINTDDSILPFANQKTDVGFLASNLAVNHPYQYAAGGAYAGIYLAKSSDSFIYKRVVQKVSEVFSFMGGIIGAVSAVLFIIKLYTDFSYEVSIASVIFKKKDDEPNSDESLQSQQTKKEDQKPLIITNFFKFCKYGLYESCRAMGKKLEWQDMKDLKLYKEEIIRQLDIMSIIKRLIFLEHSLTHLLEDYQLEGLQLQRPVTPQQIRKLRQRCNFVQEMDCSSSQNSSQKELSENDEKVSKLEEEKSMRGKTSLNKFVSVGLSSEALDKIPTCFENTCRQLSNKKHDLIISYPEKELDGVIQKDIKKEKRNSIESDISNLQLAPANPREKRMSKRKTMLKNLEKSVAEGNEVSIKIWKTMQQNKARNSSMLGPGQTDLQILRSEFNYMKEPPSNQ